MYQVSQNRFRKAELIITNTIDKTTLAKNYLIKDPESNETFEFGEEEYFLCESMDGASTPSQIVEKFKERFGLALSEEDFNAFSQQIYDFGLLESSLSPTSSSASSGYLNNTQEVLNQTISNFNEATPEKLESNLPSDKKLNQPRKTYLWVLSNPTPKFALIASLIKPFEKPIFFLLWGLIPGLLISFLTIFHNENKFWNDMDTSVTPLPYLAIYIFNISFANFTAKIAQATTLAYYGGKVEKFGLIISAKFLPRFYVDRKAILQLKKRKLKLQTFASPLLLRLVLFCLGILIWYLSRDTGTNLRTWGLLLSHAAFVDFLLDGCPLWRLDGYMFLVTYFDLPPNFLNRAYLVLEMILKRRPLPKNLSSKEKWVLLVYGPAAIIFWFGMMIMIGRGTATKLSNNFPGIFGRATLGILLCIFLAITLYKPFRFLWRKIASPAINSRPLSEIDPSIINHQKNRIYLANKSAKKQGGKFLLLIILGILLFLPYPYHPGGEIQLLPPTQQQIQAQVDGKITKVFFKGGDGQWIKAGTVIANMEAVELENAVLITQAQVKQQQAEVEKQKANLNKLLATPRKEDVAVARQQVEVVKQQVETAKQQIEVAKVQVQSAISRAEFSARQASRYQDLYKTGAFSLQQYENAQKQAETDRNNVEEQKQSLEETKQNVNTKLENLQTAQANLALVMSGPYPQDIEAARQEFESARAIFKRLQQQLKYNQDQIKRTPLLMPIDGYLVTSFLDRKVGSYFKQGETFAVVEDNRNIRGKIQIPEYNVGEFSVGVKAEVKLLAYPSKPINGKVMSIEPTTSTEAMSGDSRGSSSGDKFITVLIDIPNTEKILKAGMSGYAKIEGRTMPFIVAFTRPIIRFVQVEVWSWLP